MITMSLSLLWIGALAIGWRWQRRRLHDARARRAYEETRPFRTWR